MRLVSGRIPILFHNKPKKKAPEMEDMQTCPPSRENLRKQHLVKCKTGYLEFCLSSLFFITNRKPHSKVPQPNWLGQVKVVLRWLEVMQEVCTWPLELYGVTDTCPSLTPYCPSLTLNCPSQIGLGRWEGCSGDWRWCRRSVHALCNSMESLTPAPASLHTAQASLHTAQASL